MPRKRLLIFIIAIALLAAGAAQTMALNGSGNKSKSVALNDENVGDNQDDNAADDQYDDDDDDNDVKPPEEKPGDNNDDKGGNKNDSGSQSGSKQAPTGQAASTALPLPPRTCTSRRQFPLHLWFGAGKVRGGSVTVNGKPAHVVQSGRSSHAQVNLHGLNKGIYTASVRVRFASGKSVTFIRRYQTCTPRRIGG